MPGNFEYATASGKKLTKRGDLNRGKKNPFFKRRRRKNADLFLVKHCWG